MTPLNNLSCKPLGNLLCALFCAWSQPRCWRDAYFTQREEEVMWRSVVKCCLEVLWRSVVEKCNGEVL